MIKLSISMCLRGPHHIDEKNNRKLFFVREYGRERRMSRRVKKADGQNIILKLSFVFTLPC